MAAARPTAVVICAGDPTKDPRPNRTIRWLGENFAVRVIATGETPIDGATRVSLPAPTGARWLRKFRGALDLKLQRYEERLWPPALRGLAAEERARDPAFIVVHDLALLPLALAIRGSGRVFFDAREYYSRHFEDRWFWRFFLQKFNEHLCRTYLRQADVMVTVNRGLAEAYRKEFAVDCGVLPSFPAPAAHAPGAVDPQRIRIVHHGFASRSRRLESMIDVLRHTDDRFHLELMLVGDDPRYQEKLRRHAAGLPRVTFRPPVPFGDLVRATNSYDIGLFLVPPANFNLRHALPNKFFEFIQARLMVAIGPSAQMAAFVHAHDLGVVADDFEPRTLAARLNRLSAEDVAAYKQNAHRAAASLNTDALREKFRRVAVDGAGVEVFS